MTAPAVINTAMQSAVAATGVEYSTFPIPKGYQIIVRLYTPPEKFGAIYKPQESVKLEETASIMGQVVAMGPECYVSTDTKKFLERRCEVGDWVMFAAYSGVRFKHNGQKYRLINDDTVLAVVPDPDAVERE